MSPKLGSTRAPLRKAASSYYGSFFASPIGKAFRGDVDLTNDPADATRGELHMHGLTLTTTLTGK
jgi:hypothetical protein